MVLISNTQVLFTSYVVLFSYFSWMINFHFIFVFVWKKMKFEISHAWSILPPLFSIRFLLHFWYDQKKIWKYLVMLQCSKYDAKFMWQKIIPFCYTKKRRKCGKSFWNIVTIVWWLMTFIFIFFQNTNLKRISLFLS